ncbi:MAG: NADP-dependent phosphogluconate dehydrogenase, partial [Marinosulfonomonas sp.]|nr:NADP-dependent phosphogluconate dehydrogenase [Marinosulfonomonas sp.]
DLLTGWNAGPLQSYLVEISGKVLQAVDVETGKPVVDLIVDQAGQKGTGRWTAIEALMLGQSASTIEAAVGARSWSSEKETRKVAQTLLAADTTPTDLPTKADLEAALMAARILGHAQGFRVLQAASDEYDWQLDMPRIAEIWRAGCIIRSALLDDLADAFRSDLPTDIPRGELILAPAIRTRLNASVGALRRVVTAAIAAGVPVPVLSASLAWFDSIRTARGSTNLIQAQRDFFGEHGFKRADKDGDHHGPWKT